MDPFSRLLVAVDGSPPSSAGVAVAAQLAKSDPATRLRFVAVVEVERLVAQTADAAMIPYATDELFEAVRTGARDRLAAALAVTERLGLDAESATLEGATIDALLEEAHRWNATCIVMGTHGREGFARALLGSATEAVLRRSPLPVLVVHGTAPTEHAASLHRIVCAVDGSPPSRAAYDAAVEIASHRAATLDLLGIVQLDDTAAEGYERDGFDPEGTIAPLYGEARAPLEALRTLAQEHGVESSAHVVGAENAANTIVTYATESGADLIAIGTHGRHGLERAIVGSTAETVLRHSPVPVLAVHVAP